MPHPVHGEECPPSCRPHRPRRPRLLSLLLQGGVVTVGSIVTHIYVQYTLRLAFLGDQLTLSAVYD